MKLTDTIKLSILNIKSNIKMAVSIVVGMVIIMEIIMNIFAYGYSMNNYIINTIYKNISLRYCTSVSDDLTEEFLSNHKKEIEGIQTVCNIDINKLCKDSNYNIVTPPLENEGISLDAAVLEINNKKYSGRNDYSYDFNVASTVFVPSKDKSVRYDIGVMDYNDNLQFSQNEVNEFKNKYDKKNVFICGGQLTGENQIILTDYILKCFGYDDNLDECIGRKVNLYVSTDKGDFCIINDYTIQGIVDSDLYRVESRKGVPQIIISNSDERYCNNYSTKIFAKSFKGVVNLWENKEEVFLFPTSESLVYSEIETLYSFFWKVVVGIGFVIIISILVFVYVVIYFYFKKRNRYICIQRAMGIRNHEIYRMIFVELAILDFIAALSVVPIFNNIIIYTNRLIKNMVGKSYNITNMDKIYSEIAGVIIVLILTIIISYIECWKTKEYTVINRRE